MWTVALAKWWAVLLNLQTLDLNKPQEKRSAERSFFYVFTQSA